MSSRKIGIWLIGSSGSLGTAVAVVLAALQGRATFSTRLITEQPEFARLDLADWSHFALGGHEIRKTSATVEARNQFAGSNIITTEILAEGAPTLTNWDRNLRTGTLLNGGPDVEGRASTATLKTRGERPSTALRRLSADLEEFRRSLALEHVIVWNVASSELPPANGCGGLSYGELSQILEYADRSPLPTSALYAVAAMRSGCAYLNFTNSTGSDLPALHELAIQSSSLHMGRQGRRDLVSIGLARAPAADRSDAPNIACLSAACTLLDVTRLCERDQRRRQSGLLIHLGCFFEHPMGNGPADVPSQIRLLHEWVDQIAHQA